VSVRCARNLTIRGTKVQISPVAAPLVNKAFGTQAEKLGCSSASRRSSLRVSDRVN
jgi:hypothetical protein